MRNIHETRLAHTKAAKVKITQGPPDNRQGASGDLILSASKGGLFLYIKYGNQWFKIAEQLKPLIKGNVYLDERSDSTDGRVTSGFMNNSKLLMTDNIELPDDKFIKWGNGKTALMHGNSSGLHLSNQVRFSQAPYGVPNTVYFGINEVSLTAGYHHVMNCGIMNASPSTSTTTTLGNGVDPIVHPTVFDYSAVADATVEDMISAYWVVPKGIEIQNIQAYVTSDGATSDTIRFHVCQYTLGTDPTPVTGDAGDLMLGAIIADSADVTVVSGETLKITPDFTTYPAAEVTVDKGKVVIATIEADVASDKISARLFINYRDMGL